MNVLARTDVPTTLLEQVADKVDMIEQRQKQSNMSVYAELLARLKFDKELIRQFLREEKSAGISDLLGNPARD